jgi:hypothetical protein
MVDVPNATGRVAETATDSVVTGAPGGETDKIPGPMMGSAYPEIFPSEAEERLGRCLYQQLERLDPSYENRKWDDLEGPEQDVYLLAAKSTIRLEADATLRILSDDGIIDWCSKIRK